jgi:hypothetical protein
MSGMLTEDDARALALEMPEAVEKAHMGQADFRVRDRIFATLPKPGQMGLRLQPAEQAAVLATAPQTFVAAAGAWGRQGWTIVQLEHADPEELRELVVEAWRRRAPKTLVAAYDRAQ